MILHLAPDTPLVFRALAGAALVTHITGASLGIVSGFVALFAAKGRRLHRVAGHVFFGAMLAMSAVAAVVAPMLGDSVSALMGAFTFYLTATAWGVVRRRPGTAGRFEMAAGVYALGVATVAFAIGQIGSHLPGGQIGGQPHQIAYVLAGIALLAAVSDFRVVRLGGLIGSPRIARHLWRMCLALFIVTGSGRGPAEGHAVPAPFHPRFGADDPAGAGGAGPDGLLADPHPRSQAPPRHAPSPRRNLNRSVHMRQLSSLIIAVAIAAGAAGAAGAAQAAGPAYKAPRTAFGTPDLQGLWTNTSLTFLQRPPIFKALVATDKEAAMMEAGFKGLVGDLLKPTVDPKLPAPPVVKEAPQADILEMDLHLARIEGKMRSSWIVDPADGRIPFTDAGKKANRAANEETFKDPESRPASERCLTAVGSPEGPPMMNTGFNGNYQIVQTPGYIAINIEMNHDVRIIRMGDRTHLPRAISPWMGDSVGWWEGDTLVVETTNLRSDAPVASLGGGFTFSPKGKLTERFTRTAKDQILYQFTIDDPDYFKQPWRGEMPMRTTKGPIYEYACHEGNYSIANALSGARFEDQHPPAAKPAAAGGAAP